MTYRIGLRVRLPLGLCALGFAGALVATTPAANAEELKFASFVPPKHVMHRTIFSTMAEALGQETGGKLTMRIYPSGELGKGPKEQYKRAANGVADVTFGLHGYTSAQFPRTMLVELPGLTSDPEQATRMMWAAFEDHLAGEYKRTKALALWTNSAAVIITSEKPVRSPADMKGLKIRVASAVAGKTVEAMGGTPVFMPVPKVYNALNTGIVDGVFIGSSGIRDFKLYEPGNYATFGLPRVITTFWMVMNADTWNGLSSEHQKAVMKVSGLDLSLKATRAYVAAGKASHKLMKEKKTVIELTDAERAAFAKIFEKVRNDAIAELEAKGTPAREILNAMQAGPS